jgi:hypothetical protein
MEVCKRKILVHRYLAAAEGMDKKNEKTVKFKDPSCRNGKEDISRSNVLSRVQGSILRKNGLQQEMYFNIVFVTALEDIGKSYYFLFFFPF